MRFGMIVEHFFGDQVLECGLTFAVRVPNGAHDSFDVAVERQCSGIQEVFTFQQFHLLGGGEQAPFGTIEGFLERVNHITLLLA